MIQLVRRTMEILQYIAQNGNNVRLQDITQSLQLEKTTVHNFLKSLIELICISPEQVTAIFPDG
ncbi:helix-turn-helix domain-containing protein [Chitinophaga agri]|uniref:Helix-turn-helix domain-containing protein n=1 Tax=Chitinophaga agri TaxID=2703787 RepID=A0A6B9Z980_9BACT|nr:helix-turn-helix domain-containing protein [Chitinophaga agri]QHS58536.1 helix-turn-helix domain-containing protein [Chitinophaga agri]